MEERRQYVRVPTNIEFSYSIKSNPWGQTAKTEDVSAGGICAAVTKPVDPGVQYGIRLTLPGRQPIPITAEAVWSDQFLYTTSKKKSEFKVGLRFIRMDVQDRERLKAYVSDIM